MRLFAQRGAVSEIGIPGGGWPPRVLRSRRHARLARAISRRRSTGERGSIYRVLRDAVRISSKEPKETVEA